MENKFSTIISENWSLIIGVLSIAFISGGIISEFRVMKAEHEEDKERIELKIQQIIDERQRKVDWLQEQEERIDELEEWRAYEEGRHSK